MTTTRSVWGVYDNRDYYVSELVDNKLYTSKERAEAICEALNKAKRWGFAVEEHTLEEDAKLENGCTHP